MAQDIEAAWSDGHRKGRRCAVNVHVLIWADRLDERSVNTPSGHGSTKPGTIRVHRRMRANEEVNR